MSKFNTKAESKKPTEINAMGELAFALEAKEELVSRCMTTFLDKNGSYYESSSEEINRILSKLEQVDPLFAAKLAIYVRNEGNLRSVSHLIAAAIAKDISGTDWAKRFYDKVVVRPDDMSEILSAYASLNGMDLKGIKRIPNAIKKGFKTVLERLDAYQIDKYKMKRRNVSMIDLVRLFHPKGTAKNEEAYKRLINGESLSDLYENRILEKEMTKAGQKTAGMSEEEKMVAKEEAIATVLNNISGMPIMNLIRNLRNILLIAPYKVKDACEQLRIENKIINSRLLPFRFATAYAEIEKLSYTEKPSEGIVFESEKESKKITSAEFNELKQEILDALEDAIQISCKNIPKLEGNTAILIDHSGSVRGDAGGHSRVSAFSKTTRAMIGNLFGSMMAYSQDNVYIGLFGDRLINVPIDRSKKLLEFNRESFDIGAGCGGGTESGIYDFMRQAVKEKKKIDNVIVFSDCQIGNGGGFTPWYGRDYSDRGGHFHELFKEFRKINPLCNFIVVNITQVGGNSVFDKSQRIMNIAGWSDKIFELIASNAKGFDAMIKEIESIVI